MTRQTTGGDRERLVRLSPLIVNGGVPALLVLAWFVIPWGPVHVALGLALVALVSAHVALRTTLIRAMAAQTRRSTTRAPGRRLGGDVLLVACFAVMTLSGLLQWFGVAEAVPWHVTSSYLLVALALWHAAKRRRRMRTPFPRTHS